MIPRTYPSRINPTTGRREALVSFISSTTGLQRWVDYTPVAYVTSATPVEGSYNNNGYIAIADVGSTTGLQAGVDYIRVYLDPGASDAWQVNSVGFIPIGISGIGGVPYALFANNEQGVWYDPSDFSTLFQDAAGTTPVTAVEQPVGLMLDKSKGLVLGSELVTNGDFSNGTTGWTAAAVDVGLNVVSGQLEIDTNTNAISGAYQSFSTVAGKTYKATAIVRNGTATDARLRAVNGFTNTGTLLADSSVVTATTNTEVSVVFTATGTASTVYLRVNGLDKTAYFDNISVKELPGNHAFQSTPSSRPILRRETNGAYYLAFDGTDDWLQTNSINFTSTDKMTVFAGVRKLSDAATGVFMETGTNAGSTQSSFALLAPSSGGTNSYRVFSSGSITADTSGAFAGTGVFAPAPITNVLSGIGDISGDVTTLRVNGTQVATSSADQGTGNYGNYPLYIGRRAGTSLPFNGRLYSLIIRGASTVSSLVSATESFVATKTGITL